MGKVLPEDNESTLSWPYPLSLRQVASCIFNAGYSLLRLSRSKIVTSICKVCKAALSRRRVRTLR